MYRSASLSGDVENLNRLHLHLNTESLTLFARMQMIAESSSNRYFAYLIENKNTHTQDFLTYDKCVDGMLSSNVAADAHIQIHRFAYMPIDFHT